MPRVKKKKEKVCERYIERKEKTERQRKTERESAQPSRWATRLKDHGSTGALDDDDDNDNLPKEKVKKTHRKEERQPKTYMEK